MLANRSQPRATSWRAVLIGMLFALVTSPAFAQLDVSSWTDGIGSWFNETNWSNGVPGYVNGMPGSNLSAGIENGGTAIIAANSVTGVAVGIGGGGSGNLTVTGSGQLDGIMFVGGTVQGTLSVTNGGTLTSVDNIGYIGTIGGHGTANIDGLGSSWTIGKELYIGEYNSAYSGTGILNITNGGAVSNDDACIGGYFGAPTVSTGTVTVTDSGSRWTNSGDLFIGIADDGRLIVQSGAAASSGGNTVLGEEETGYGTIDISGAGSEVTVGNELVVGRFGRGDLVVSDSAKLSAAFVTFGKEIDSTFTANVSGNGVVGSTQVTISEELDVAVQGIGSFNLTGGATRWRWRYAMPNATAPSCLVLR